MRKTIFAASCVLLVIFFLLASAYYKKQRVAELGFMAQKNAATFVREHSPALGEDDAKVYLVKFTDPACETCAAFSDFVKEGMRAYPGKIKLVIRYAPFHEGADEVVKILEAARKQGKFWETLETLYKFQGYWTHHHQVQLQEVWKFLPELGLDVARIKRDMNDPEIAKIIAQDLADAQTLNVQKTPGFFVNGKPLEPFGAQQLQQLIVAEIKAKYPNP